jgi:hypothetical protein
MVTAVVGFVDDVAASSPTSSFSDSSIGIRVLTHVDCHPRISWPTTPTSSLTTDLRSRHFDVADFFNRTDPHFFAKFSRQDDVVGTIPILPTSHSGATFSNRDWRNVLRRRINLRRTVELSSQLSRPTNERDFVPRYGVFGGNLDDFSIPLGFHRSIVVRRRRRVTIVDLFTRQLERHSLGTFTRQNGTFVAATTDLVGQARHLGLHFGQVLPLTIKDLGGILSKNSSVLSGSTLPWCSRQDTSDVDWPSSRHQTFCQPRLQSDWCGPLGLQTR